MAGLSTDIWEFRATAGSANSGGGFDTASGGTDFSDQDSAQLQLTDLATSGIGVTTLTSATGGFTSTMVGNYIQIRSGTNVTAGFYRVTTHTDTNTVTLDRAPDNGVGGISSGAGDLGGALDVMTDALVDSPDVVVAGNTLHVKNDGTANLGALSLTKDGTVTAYIIVDGYNTSRGDNPKGADRPVLASGSSTHSYDNFWIIKNLIVTISNASGMGVDKSSRVINCKVTNSGAAGSIAIDCGPDQVHIIRCEAISTNGIGIGMTSSTGSRIISCYIHDSVTGIETGGEPGNVFINNVFDTCSTAGINADASTGDGLVYGNTFYNCGKGINAASGSLRWLIYNNIFDANTTGVEWGDTQVIDLDFNCWDNTTDVTNVSKGDSSVTGDPGLTDPANGDFTLGSGSNCLDTGLQMGTDQGAVGDYKMNIGVDQDDVSAGGGLLTHPGMAGGARG